MFRIIIRYRCRCSHDNININDIPSLDSIRSMMENDQTSLSDSNISHHSRLSVGMRPQLASGIRSSCCEDID